MTRLKDKLLHVSVWQELRSAFQSSLLAQKMGLFHHSTLACIPSTGQEVRRNLEATPGLHFESMSV